VYAIMVARPVSICWCLAAAAAAGLCVSFQVLQELTGLTQNDTLLQAVEVPLLEHGAEHWLLLLLYMLQVLQVLTGLTLNDKPPQTQYK
jgi:hypothetical protein